MRLVAGLLLVLGASVLAWATVPEINPGSGANALALIAAAVVVYRGRRKD